MVALLQPLNILVSTVVVMKMSIPYFSTLGGHSAARKASAAAAEAKVTSNGLTDVIAKHGTNAGVDQHVWD